MKEVNDTIKKQVIYLLDGPSNLENYLVYTETNALKAAIARVKEEVWAFSPNFIASHSNVPLEMIEAFQDNGKCEDNNATLLKCLKSFKTFALDAIFYNGLGHFLSPYDGETHEIDLNGKTYYVFRQN